MIGTCALCGLPFGEAEPRTFEGNLWVCHIDCNTAVYAAVPAPTRRLRTAAAASQHGPRQHRGHPDAA